MNVMLDLFSGLGGASEAFAQAGWTVIRIENNPELQYVPFTQNWDVLKWESWADALPKVDLVWASPPCREFSNAYAAPGPSAQRANLEFEPDMRLVQASMEIIEYLAPKYWVVENVIGAKKWFEFRQPTSFQQIGSFCLWKSPSVPHITIPYEFSHTKAEQDTWSTDPLRANKKAMIPFEVSFGLLGALTEQQTLEKWG